MKSFAQLYLEAIEEQKPICTIEPNGRKKWTLNGVYHRVDGPAVEHPDGEKWWYQNGRLHRLDGPAVERPDGTKFWYLNGSNVTEARVKKYKLKPKPQTQHITLMQGKRVLVEGEAQVADYASAKLSKTTRANLELYKANQKTFGKEIVYDKVYTIDRSGRGAMSYYITGTLDGVPFTYARIETASRGAGQTKIYFPKKSYLASVLIYKSRYVDTVSGENLIKEGPPYGYTHFYKMDGENKLQHRLDGPAVMDSQGSMNEFKEYYINGKEYSKNDFDKLVSKFKPGDISTALDALDI